VAPFIFGPRCIFSCFNHVRECRDGRLWTQYSSFGVLQQRWVKTPSGSLQSLLGVISGFAKEFNTDTASGFHIGRTAL